MHSTGSVLRARHTSRSWSVNCTWHLTTGRSCRTQTRTNSMLSQHKVASGDLSWTVPPPLEEDYGLALADRDARLQYRQQLEQGALPPDAGPEPFNLVEVFRWA